MNIDTRWKQVNRTLFRSICKLIQVVFIVVLVVVIDSSNTKVEMKVLNDNYNKSIDFDKDFNNFNNISIHAPANGATKFSLLYFLIG